jgi:chorismate dehydratase
MPKLRISAISYLNTAPLMWDFEHGSAGSNFDISYTVPSQCALQLRDGSADIGIIPAAAYTSIAEVSILPGVAIASRRAVRSILLISKLPIEKIKKVALDTSSLTSAALTKVLFDRWWGGARTYTAANPNLKEMLAESDAALVIGDPALQVDRTSYLTFDLAEEWIRLTGKPFVFAFWAVRQKALLNTDTQQDLAQIFQQSRDHGLQAENLSAIAEEWAPRVNLSKEDVRNYLTRNIHYSLDPDCLEGLRLFFQYAAACGALPHAPELDFLSQAIHS